MCGSALAGPGSADGLVSRVVGRVSVVVGASCCRQAVTSSTRATPPNHLITRPSSRTVDWSIRIGAEARRGPPPIWNSESRAWAAVEVRRLRSAGGGVSRRTSVRSGHWQTSCVQSPAPTQARSPTGGTSKDFRSDPSLADLLRPKSPRPGQPCSPGPRSREGLRTDPVTGRPPASKVPAPRPAAQPRAEVSRRTSVRSGHWPTFQVQSPRAQASSPGRGGVSRTTSVRSGHWADLPRPKSPRPPSRASGHARVGTRRTAPGLSCRGRSLVNLERKGSDRH